ncbi:hypothetical protein GCM10010124_17080 [Pilimelia terevasa]|uniref:Uncharacterized protein n=1 Tax=Pilimelia terevasa TaxID=53372 RepID=A0A8J3FH85_9ACTN|nr:hypothetical protein GCM10010124_17080 [Pilimelia terevasa]
MAAALLAAAAPAPAEAAALRAGDRVRVTGAPGTLRAGDDARLTSTVRQPGGLSLGRLFCQRVRWAVQATATGGLAIDDLRLTRDENGRAVPVDETRDGRTLSVVDRRDDEGRLCRGDRVTTRYRLAADRGAGSGRVALTVTALDGGGRRLGDASVTVRVAGAAAPTPAPDPGDSAPPDADDTGGDDSGTGDTGADDGGADDTGAADPGADGSGADDGATITLPSGQTVPASSNTDLPVSGFAFGTLMLLGGGGFLLNMYYRRQYGPEGVRGRHGRLPPLVGAAARLPALALAAGRDRRALAAELRSRWVDLRAEAAWRWAGLRARLRRASVRRGRR